MSGKDEERGDHKPKEVTIHVDGTAYKSPNPTTGAALYVLGKVKEGYDLFREVRGKGDDELIKNEGSPVELKNGDHFYSAQSTLNPGA